MQGAEKMYQALLSSPTSKQQEERIRGPDSRADCWLLFKWKEVKRILKEIFLAKALFFVVVVVVVFFLSSSSSFITIRIAVSFFVKKCDMACTIANRLLFLFNFLDLKVCFTGFLEITEPHVFLKCPSPKIFYFLIGNYTLLK